MKLTPEDFQSLADELLPERPAVSRSQVLALVRSERVRRRRQRTLLLALPLILLGALLWLQHSATRPTDPIARVASAPKPPAIETVDDKQLLKMLEGVPAALMQWPDGRQALLVLNYPAGQ